MRKTYRDEVLESIYNRIFVLDNMIDDILDNGEISDVDYERLLELEKERNDLQQEIDELRE
jgi:hypothetical protein